MAEDGDDAEKRNLEKILHTVSSVQPSRIKGLQFMLESEGINISVEELAVALSEFKSVDTLLSAFAWGKIEENRKQLPQKYQDIMLQYLGREDFSQVNDLERPTKKFKASDINDGAKKMLEVDAAKVKKHRKRSKMAEINDPKNFAVPVTVKNDLKSVLQVQKINGDEVATDKKKIPHPNGWDVYDYLCALYLHIRNLENKINEKERDRSPNVIIVEGFFASCGIRTTVDLHRNSFGKFYGTGTDKGTGSKRRGKDANEGRTGPGYDLLHEMATELVADSISFGKDQFFELWDILRGRNSDYPEFDFVTIHNYVWGESKGLQNACAQLEKVNTPLEMYKNDGNVAVPKSISLYTYSDKSHIIGFFLNQKKEWVLGYRAPIVVEAGQLAVQSTFYGISEELQNSEVSDMVVTEVRSIALGLEVAEVRGIIVEEGMVGVICCLHLPTSDYLMALQQNEKEPSTPALKRLQAILRKYVISKESVSVDDFPRVSSVLLDYMRMTKRASTSKLEYDEEKPPSGGGQALNLEYNAEKSLLGGAPMLNLESDAVEPVLAGGPTSIALYTYSDKSHLVGIFLNEQKKWVLGYRSLAKVGEKDDTVAAELRNILIGLTTADSRGIIKDSMIVILWCMQEKTCASLRLLRKDKRPSNRPPIAKLQELLQKYSFNILCVSTSDIPAVKLMLSKYMAVTKSSTVSLTIDEKPVVSGLEKTISLYTHGDQSHFIGFFLDEDKKWRLGYRGPRVAKEDASHGITQELERFGVVDDAAAEVMRIAIGLEATVLYGIVNKEMLVIIWCRERKTWEFLRDLRKKKTDEQSTLRPLQDILRKNHTVIELVHPQDASPAAEIQVKYIDMTRRLSTSTLQYDEVLPHESI